MVRTIGSDEVTMGSKGKPGMQMTSMKVKQTIDIIRWNSRSYPRVGIRSSELLEDSGS